MRNALVLTLLAIATPALAQSNPPTAAPPPPQPLAVKITIKVGGDTRVHDLAIVDNGCGGVEAKAPSYEDDIHVCARPAGAGVLIEVNWKARTNDTEHRTKSSAIMMRKNSKLEVGSSNGPRFTLQLL